MHGRDARAASDQVVRSRLRPAAVVSRRAPSAPLTAPESGDLLWWPQFASAALAPSGIPVERVSSYTPVVADRPLEQLPSEAVTRTSGETTCARITLGYAAR